jgi:hypothetical protein
LTGAIRFRFRACDQLFQSFVEAAIDDFSIEVFAPDAATVADSEAAPSPSRLAQSFPNPAGAFATIRFRLSNPGATRLAIFDPSGRKLRTLVEGDLAAGSHAVAWDGRNDAGAAVANGVYFYRLESGAFRQSRRLSLLR